MTVTAPAVPVTDGRPAPLPGCKCAVCNLVNRRRRLDEDLASNYGRYLSGELVSKDDEE